MLCELVQAGIGGRTIEEAAQRLSWDEIEVWRLYIEKWGRLHAGMRIETEFAVLRHWLWHYTQKSQPRGIEDFMEHPPKEQEEDIDDSFDSLRRMAAGLMVH